MIKTVKRLDQFKNGGAKFRDKDYRWIDLIIRQVREEV